MRLAVVAAECRTYCCDAAGSTPGQIAFKWFVLGWLTVCGQANHIGI